VIKDHNLDHSENPQVTDHRNFTPPDANSSENSRMSLHSAAILLSNMVFRTRKEDLHNEERTESTASKKACCYD
jgi:hypothetical protein